MLSFIRSDLAQLVAYQPHQEESLGPNSHADPEPRAIDQLDTNESPFDLPEDLKQKLAWTYQHTIAANRYPDGGHELLKRAIAEYVNESANLPPDVFGTTHISVGNGSDELIRSLLIATCLGGEGSILVAQPTFSMYAILAHTLGIPVVAVERTTNFEIDLQAAQATMEQPHTPPIRVVFVVHPNSPTGNALTNAEIDWLRGLPKSILVVIDEAYFEFSQTTLVSELSQHPNWVLLRTFSKAFRLAAHRIGYAIAHPELIAALEKVRLPYNLPSMTQAAALTALAYRSDLLQSVPQLLAQRDRIARHLAQHSALQMYSSAGNFIFVRLKQGVTSNPDSILQTVFRGLQSQGTRIRHVGGGLRITVGSPEENDRLLARLPAILDSCLENRA